MNNVRTLPNDSTLAFEGDDLPSLGEIIKHEPRGAALTKVLPSPRER